MSEATRPWPPTMFRRFARSLGTSTSPARIMTDAGPAYIKTLGNPQGPHVLACDLVGTRLARWFGLRTFDDAVLTIEGDDEIPLHGGGRALPGPAYATREENGGPWSGSPDELASVENLDDVSRLVVFDTWLLNCDRHPADLTVRAPNHDNVFLSGDGASAGHFRLTAIDHGCCFTCGRELSARVATIDRVRDERIYGLFPAFREFLRPAAIQAAIEQLRGIREHVVGDIIAAVPAAWDLNAATRLALRALILDRAAFLAGDSRAFEARLLG